MKDIEEEFEEKLNDYENWGSCVEDYLSKPQSEHKTHYFYKYNPDFQLYIIDTKNKIECDWYKGDYEGNKKLLETYILLQYKTTVIKYCQAYYFFPEKTFIIPISQISDTIYKNSTEFKIGNIINKGHFEEYLNSKDEIEINIK